MGSVRFGKFAHVGIACPAPFEHLEFNISVLNISEFQSVDVMTFRNFDILTFGNFETLELRNLETFYFQVRESQYTSTYRFQPLDPTTLVGDMGELWGHEWSWGARPCQKAFWTSCWKLFGRSEQKSMFLSCFHGGSRNKHLLIPCAYAPWCLARRSFLVDLGPIRHYTIR